MKNQLLNNTYFAHLQVEEGKKLEVGSLETESQKLGRPNVSRSQKNNE